MKTAATPDPLAQLTEIRAIMERSSRFLSLSGLSGVGAGVVVLLGAAAGHFNPQSEFPDGYLRLLSASAPEWQAALPALLLAAGNREAWMTAYNLQLRFRSVDIGFLLDLPDRTLLTLLARRAVLNHATQLTVNAKYGSSAVIDAPEAQRRLDRAMAAARARYADYTDWQGLTWVDWQTRQALLQGMVAGNESIFALTKPV